MRFLFCNCNFLILVLTFYNFNFTINYFSESYNLNFTNFSAVYSLTLFRDRFSFNRFSSH